MNSQPTSSLMESLFGQTKEYIDDRLELLKLKTIDKSASAVSAAIAGVAIFVVFFIFFIVFNIGLALLIGDLLGKSYWGFLILAAIYAIVGLVILSKRSKLFKEPIIGLMIRKFL